MSNHQIAVEKLKKAAEVLLDTRGELTPDKEEIQKTLGKIFAFLNAFFLSLVSACIFWKRKITELPHSYVSVPVHVLLSHKSLQHNNFIVDLSPSWIHMLFTVISFFSFYRNRDCRAEVVIC